MLLKRLSSFFMVFCLFFSINSFHFEEVDAARLNKKATLETAYELLQSQNGFFTENKGQWDPEILFMGDTSFGKVAFTKEAVYYQLIKIEESSNFDDMHDSNLLLDPMNFMDNETARKIETQTIKLSFVDGKTLNIQGEEILPHYNNYFIGSDETKWASNCRNFSKIYYEDVWSGIDLAYFLHQKE